METQHAVIWNRWLRRNSVFQHPESIVKLLLFAVDDCPSYSSRRTTLGKVVEKGWATGWQSCGFAVDLIIAETAPLTTKFRRISKRTKQECGVTFRDGKRITSRIVGDSPGSVCTRRLCSSCPEVLTLDFWQRKHLTQQQKRRALSTSWHKKKAKTKSSA